MFIKSGYTNWDRSFDLRIDILKENKYLPDLTMGLQDFIGTGMYSGEYLVASKTFLSNLRLTAGLGWGRLSSNRVISKTGDRSSSSSELGGTLNYERFFKGNVSSFGGFEYQTPINSLRIKAEVSSDDYSADNYLSTYSVDNNYNYGIDYDLNDTLNLSAYYLNESELGLRFKISTNPANSPGNLWNQFLNPFIHFQSLKKTLVKIILKN